MPIVLPPRLARAAREHRPALAAAALVALALGTLWSTQAVAAPQREVVTIPAPDAWRETGRFTYAVPVENASGPYPAGTVLGMGEPGYLTTLSPHALVTFAWSAEGLRAERVTGHASLRLVVQGASGWRVERDLANLTFDQAPDAPVRLDAVLDVAGTLSGLRSAGHADETATWSLVARVARAAPEPAAQAFTLAVHVDAPLYVLPAPSALATVVPHGEPRVEVHEERAGAAGLLRAPAGPLLALAGAGVLALVLRAKEEDA